MNALKSAVARLAHWIRLGCEVWVAIAPAMFAGASVGSVTAGIVPDFIAFSVALVAGAVVFVVIRITMATYLQSIVLDSTVENCSLR